jgi:hypothetical protein
MLEVIFACHRGAAVAEPAKPSAGPVRANPLYGDPLLFDMYMSALDIVLAEQEVRSAFDEFDLSAATLRMIMVSGAGRVLGAASREFAAYEEAMRVIHKIINFKLIKL